MAALDRCQLRANAQDLTWRERDDRSVCECHPLASAGLIANANTVGRGLEIESTTPKSQTQGLGQRINEAREPSFERDRPTSPGQQTA
jgi:hypothetical protein